MFKYLFFDDNMVNFLRLTSKISIISQVISGGEIGIHLKDEMNYIAFDSEDKVSYVPKSKFEKTKDPWKENRVSVRIGRFVKKIITEFSEKSFNINDSSIEEYVNIFKSYFSSDESELRVVSGSDIPKYYLEKNYYRLNRMANGTLWNSCMRQEERNRFMKLYENNPERVKMLILVDGDDKIKGRALLWESVKNSKGVEYKVMDRIYTYQDYEVNTFKRWATENGYIHKWRQDASSETLFSVDGERQSLDLYVELDCKDINEYPYLDTFKFYNISDNKFMNNSYNYDYLLNTSNGRPRNEDLDVVDEYDFDFDDDDL